ncbi:acyl-CoA dehydrogenase family protein [Thermodesulfobacteriota bacterium]
MDYKLTEKQEALKKAFEDFFREEMRNAPLEYRKSGAERFLSNDETWQFHRYLSKRLIEKGWLVRHWPKEYGGEDAPIIEQLIFNEVRGYYGAPGVDLWGINMFGPTILVAGTEEQKKRLLPPIARSEVHYCQGWSEPNAGSDLASLITTAIRDGDHYVLNGQKIWTSGAQRADHIFLLVRTDPSQTRNAGLSVLSARLDLPGIEVRPIYYMNGSHLYNEVFFSDVHVPAEDRIGPENEGWRVTRETMNFERSGIEYFSEARRALEEIVRYVKTTRRDGVLLSENPVVRQKIAHLYSDLELGRALCYKIAWLQETGGMRLAASAASESKVFGSELIQRLANFATEIMGFYGELGECERAPVYGSFMDLYQMCLGYNLAGGTSEIQRNLIAWVGLGLPRFK